MRKTHFAYPASIPALTMLGPVLPPVLDPAILYSMFRYFAHITAAILVIFSGPGVRAEHIQAPTQFIRVKSSSNGTPLSLDTSIVTYTGKNKSGESIAVDLVGAVHVADAVYYTKLNQQFQNYDRLLYELVAPKDHSVPNSLRSSQVRTAPVRTSALSALQLG